MPEIGTSGLTRAGAARKLAPPLLYLFAPVTPKPCPCGGLAFVRSSPKLDGTWYLVVYQQSGRMTTLRPTGPEAVESWNERISSTA
jgi:hypothetical protein